MRTLNCKYLGLYVELKSNIAMSDSVSLCVIKVNQFSLRHIISTAHHLFDFLEWFAARFNHKTYAEDHIQYTSDTESEHTIP